MRTLHFFFAAPEFEFNLVRVLFFLLLFGVYFLFFCLQIFLGEASGTTEIRGCADVNRWEVADRVAYNSVQAHLGSRAAAEIYAARASPLVVQIRVVCLFLLASSLSCFRYFVLSSCLSCFAFLPFSR